MLHTKLSIQQLLQPEHLLRDEVIKQQPIRVILIIQLFNYLVLDYMEYLELNNGNYD